MALRPVVQDVHIRTARSQFRRQMDGIDEAELLAAGRALLHQKPWLGADLGRALAPRWPDADPWVLQIVNRYHHALVQIPPRGLWGRSGRALHVLAEDWLGEPPEHADPQAHLVARYLGGFGPASATDVASFAMLPVTAIRVALERVAPRRFRDERGTELFDVPRAPLPHPDTEAPVRFPFEEHTSYTAAAVVLAADAIAGASPASALFTPRPLLD